MKKSRFRISTPPLKSNWLNGFRQECRVPSAERSVHVGHLASTAHQLWHASFHPLFSQARAFDVVGVVVMVVVVVVGGCIGVKEGSPVHGRQMFAGAAAGQHLWQAQPFCGHAGQSLAKQVGTESLFPTFPWSIVTASASQNVAVHCWPSQPGGPDVAAVQGRSGPG